MNPTLCFAGVSLFLVCGGCASSPALMHADASHARPVHSIPAFDPEPQGEPIPPAPYAKDYYAPSGLYESQSQPRLEWSSGQLLLQGYLGVSAYSRIEAGDGGIDGDDGDLDNLPVIGGGAQWKFGGERVDFGFEGLLSFSGAANAEAFAVGGGGAVIAVDIDLLIFELYGGPFASIFIGDKMRAYVSAGPLLQWADYDQDDSDPSFEDDGSGFGSGWYARTGLEFALASRTLIGLGVRWSDSSVDLGGSLNDLEIEGLQALFTITQGL